MKCLEFPFDENYIMSKKKKIKRELLESRSDFIDKKIAILGGSTTNDIKLTLELFLLDFGIRPSFYESEYDQYYQDAMMPNPELSSFAPDIIYIHTTNRNITSYPHISDRKEDVDALVDSQYRKFSEMWDHVRKVYNCPIIQNNFEMPLYRLMGNKDATDIHGKVNFLSRLNLLFAEYAQTHDNFYICDINYISADFGLYRWADTSFYHMYKYALSYQAIPHLSFNVALIIKSIFGKNKKGFVLDLDNTLWGGIIGDDGVDNINLGPEEPEGRVFTEFQEYIKEHKDLGIILNIDSKNDRENAIAGLNHPDSSLKEDDFVIIKANWDPKDRNFSDIAKGLDLLPESLVFVDDNPAERHIISETFKGVAAPNIGQPQDYIKVIDRSGFFEVTVFSEDDKKRGEMYIENQRRKDLQESFTDYGEYLISLDMHAVIKNFESVYMARIAQLSNKSNQFNLTTRRYTQTEIESLAADDEYVTLCGRLSDRFGNNGVVSVVIGHILGDTCHMDLWIMSCRVLKRDMEFAMMDTLVHRLKERGIYKIKGYYYPTAKNNMVREFYSLMDFTKVSEDEKGNTEWEYEIKESREDKNRYIKVEE